jgi:arylformamidase
MEPYVSDTPPMPSPADAQFQYVEGQGRPGFAALLADYEVRSAQALALPGCQTDIRYGPAERQTFDFFPALGDAVGTMAYFHAGYWQSRDKSGFRFLAPAFTAQGLNVALVNYPLCPGVTLAALVEAARAAVPAIGARLTEAGQGEHPLIAAGHSAGAHLAVELALTRRTAPGDPTIDGVIALSGIYDLVPLVGTTLNARLQLDADSAARLSPVHRVRPGAPPALFAVGGAETPAFVEQNQRMHERWRAAGLASEAVVVPGADHFSLLQDWISPDGVLAAPMARLLALARHRRQR